MTDSKKAIIGLTRKRDAVNRMTTHIAALTIAIDGLSPNIPVSLAAAKKLLHFVGLFDRLVEMEFAAEEAGVSPETVDSYRQTQRELWQAYPSAATLYNSVKRRDYLSLAIVPKRTLH
ncbi:MAG: hypothetical protein AAGI27_03570 [Pseudomonadota bacterium]